MNSSEKVTWDRGLPDGTDLALTCFSGSDAFTYKSASGFDDAVTLVRVDALTVRTGSATPNVGKAAAGPTAPAADDRTSEGGGPAFPVVPSGGLAVISGMASANLAA